MSTIEREVELERMPLATTDGLADSASSVLPSPAHASLSLNGNVTSEQEVQNEARDVLPSPSRKGQAVTVCVDNASSNGVVHSLPLAQPASLPNSDDDDGHSLLTLPEREGERSHSRSNSSSRGGSGHRRSKHSKSRSRSRSRKQSRVDATINAETEAAELDPRLPLLDQSSRDELLSLARSLLSESSRSDALIRALSSELDSSLSHSAALQVEVSTLHSATQEALVQAEVLRAEVRREASRRSSEREAWRQERERMNKEVEQLRAAMRSAGLSPTSPSAAAAAVTSAASSTAAAASTPSSSSSPDYRINVDLSADSSAASDSASQSATAPRDRTRPARHKRLSSTQNCIPEEAEEAEDAEQEEDDEDEESSSSDEEQQQTLQKSSAAVPAHLSSADSLALASIVPLSPRSVTAAEQQSLSQTDASPSSPSAAFTAASSAPPSSLPSTLSPLAPSHPPPVVAASPPSITLSSSSSPGAGVDDVHSLSARLEASQARVRRLEARLIEQQSDWMLYLRLLQSQRLLSSRSGGVGSSTAATQTPPVANAPAAALGRFADERLVYVTPRIWKAIAKARVEAERAANAVPTSAAYALPRAAASLPSVSPPAAATSVPSDLLSPAALSSSHRALSPDFSSPPLAPLSPGSHELEPRVLFANDQSGDAAANGSSGGSIEAAASPSHRSAPRSIAERAVTPPRAISPDAFALLPPHPTLYFSPPESRELRSPPSQSQPDVAAVDANPPVIVHGFAMPPFAAAPPAAASDSQRPAASRSTSLDLHSPLFHE